MRWLLLAGLLFACDDGGEADTDAAPNAEAGVDAGALDFGPETDGGAPLSLEAVAGDLTFAEGRHLFSVQTNGGLKQRITTEPGVWSHHAVGPDPRFVIAVRHGDADGDGVDDADGPGTVWVLDVRERVSYPISPAECDAGIGGVGWRDEVRVLFAMDCGDGPSAVYLANSGDRSRDRANMLTVSDHEVAVRDVFPAVATPLYAYVLDAEICSPGGSCITKPQVWVADADIGVRCQLSDGDQMFTDTSTITGTPRRLGDHGPSFNGDLSSVVFSRNVGGKGDGPVGHHDLMRVGLDRRALFRGDPTCSQGGTLVNLSENLVTDEYPGPDGPAPGIERFPRGPAGRAPVGTVLYTAEVHGEARSSSAIYIVDPAGTRTALTPESGQARFGAWIVIDYMLDGER